MNKLSHNVLEQLRLRKLLILVSVTGSVSSSTETNGIDAALIPKLDIVEMYLWKECIYLSLFLITIHHLSQQSIFIKVLYGLHNKVQC